MDKMFGNPLYRKGRPFLIVNSFRRPSVFARTSKKGWQNEPNAEQIDEEIKVMDHISLKTLREATVIIDVVQTKFVKYRYAENASPTEDEVINYYLEKYKQQVADGITAWMRKRARTAPVTEAELQSA